MKKLAPYVACLLLLSACIDEPQPKSETEEDIIDEVFEIVENRATFKGGDTAWQKYLQRTITYPQEALKEGVGGRVYVSFVVSSSGKVIDAKLVRGVGHGIDEAALAAVKSSPDWNPGEQRGRDVNSRMIVSFAFEPVSDSVGKVSVNTKQKPEVQEIEIVETVTPHEDDIFSVVEEEATFKGGTEAWADHLKNNLVYPEQAKREGIEGRVFVTFVVNDDGQISDPKIVRGIGAGCDEAALEVIKNSPNWIPGKQKGVAVNSRMAIAISFRL